MKRIPTSPNSILYRASRNANTPFDFDRNKFIYKLKYSDLEVKLTSPIPDTIERFKFLLLYDSELKKLEPKYYQRPDLLSYDEYGTEQLDWILMYVNNVFCYEDFVLPEVYVPSYASITEVSNFLIPDKFRLQEVELE